VFTQQWSRSARFYIGIAKPHGNVNCSIVAYVWMVHFGKQTEGMCLRIVGNFVQPEYRPPDNTSLVKDRAPFVSTFCSQSFIDQVG